MGGEIAKTNNMCPNAQDVALGTEISKLQALASELRTDHATFKAAADAVETLIEELYDDHATFKAAVDSLVTLANELKTDHNALLAKLDADAGVTDTNYAASHTIAAADASAAPATLTAAKPASAPATITAAAPSDWT